MSKAIPASVKLGALAVTWKDSNLFEYQHGGKAYRYDIAAGKAEETGKATKPDPSPFKKKGKGGFGKEAKKGMGKAPERGRQFTSAVSPDGKVKATYRDRILWICDPKGGNEYSITTDGDEKKRIKNGSASWVYGEELFQNTAMWWSPD